MAHVVRDPCHGVGRRRPVPGHVSEGVHGEQERGDFHVQVQLQRALPVHFRPGLFVHLQADRGPGGQPAADQRVGYRRETEQRRYREREIVDGLLEEPETRCHMVTSGSYVIFLNQIFVERSY